MCAGAGLCCLPFPPDASRCLPQPKGVSRPVAYRCLPWSPMVSHGHPWFLVVSRYLQRTFSAPQFCTCLRQECFWWAFIIVIYQLCLGSLASIINITFRRYLLKLLVLITCLSYIFKIRVFSYPSNSLLSHLSKLPLLVALSSHLL